MEEIILNSNNYDLCVHVFSVDNPKACIQIIHGMEEHQERYEDFAHFLNKNGFNVVTSDLRGHGKTAKKLGHISEKDGHILLVKDQEEILNFINERFSNLDVFLFGHSMGSIIARNVLMNNSAKYKKVILSGFPNPNKGASMGLKIAKTIKFFHGNDYFSKFLQKNAVGSFNKPFKNGKTDVDWLSANDQSNQNYIDDPYCGHGFTVQSFIDLFNLVKNMSNYKNYKMVVGMPMLLLRGEDDPATGYNDGAKDTIKVLNNAGFTNINEIVYKGMRHEILNELEHQKVYDDVLAFITK